MVRPGRESFKRFIRTIVDLLPPHIEKYPPSDQLLLQNFLSVLQHYDEADYQRNILSQRFNEYSDSLLGTDQYLQIAFLWFVQTYLTNANNLLKISKFHANTYYEYLVRHLRGSNNVPGAFELIRNQVPLTNLAWEKLQYESHKLIIPLTNDQLDILTYVNSAVLEEGIRALDSRKLKMFIFNQKNFPKKVNSNEELTRFFNLIDGEWAYRFFSPGFGLDWVFIQFQVEESTFLEDIIDFQQSQNTVISASDLYIARDLPNTYLGTLIIPSQELDRLINYFQRCERQGSLILNNLEKITTRSFSNSLTHYRANVGWYEQSPTRMRRLTQVLQAENPKKILKEDSLLFTPPQFNLDWHYHQHPLPTELIKLFCKISSQTYSYENLPFNQEISPLTRTDVGLLKQLFYNQVLQFRFVPWRLIREFSLDVYCIILPKIPNFQLKHFLNLIPVSDIFFAEESIYIWTRLTPKLSQWITNDLNWTIISVTRKFVPSKLEFDYFDPLELQWRAEQFLGR
ncbi:MAG: hypothetical protein ACFFDC_05280 [Promethearchaeota archaeon]